jgi:NAD(P)H-hydrate repair Nnr-like enzyme with NAD(P)H-hydrate epimerase domain
MSWRRKRVQVIDPKNDAVAELEKAVEENELSALVDGFLGMQAKLPLRDPLPEILQWINQCDKIAVRAAVDLPTGVTAEGTEESITGRLYLLHRNRQTACP